MDAEAFARMLSRIPLDQLYENEETEEEEPQEEITEFHPKKTNKVLGKLQKQALESRYGRLAASMELECLPEAMLSDLEKLEMAQWMLEQEEMILRKIKHWEDQGLQPWEAEEIATAVENVLPYTPENPRPVSIEVMKKAWQNEFPGTRMEDYLDW